MKNFKESEFVCPCKYKCGLGFKDMSKEAIKRLIKARKKADTPFVINSAIRCPDHNKDVGGSVTSSHLTGEAFDIFCKYSRQRFRIVRGLILAGFTRIEIKEDYIHVDISKEKAQQVLWLQ